MVLIAAALTMGTGVILHHSNTNMAIYCEKDRITSAISKGVFELNLLTNYFLKHPLDRALGQWNQRYNSLVKIIDDNKSLFQGELSYFKEMEQNLNDLKTAFYRLGKEINSGQKGTQLQGHDSKLLLYEAKFSTLSHNIIFSAQALEALIQSQLKASQDHAMRMIFFLFLSFSGLILLFSGIILYGILKPVLLLTKGVEAIGKGDFDHKIKVSKQDEIGFLAKTVNEMSRRLSEITVHRSRLEQEIAERTQVERKIIESEELFRAVFEQAGGYCMILQPTDNGIPTIFDANQAACKTHGYTKAEMIGRPVADLDDEEGKRLCIERTQRIMTGKPFTVENIHVRKDGSTFPVAVYANMVRFKDKPPLIVTTEFDISDRKKAEAEKKSLEKRLQQAQKMESIGNLAGGIAHDFNNLLYPIIGFAEMFMEDFPPGSPEHDSAQEIFAAGKRGGELVKQILAFSRQTDHELQQVRIQKILEEVLKLTRSSIPSDIEIHQDIQQNCGPMMADPTQLHQIAMNLITNAYHAVEQTSGKISVQLKEIMLDAGEINDSALQPGTYAMLSVSDTGTGISPDVINNIFEPYFTTKAQGKGTGLGLAVAYGIVKEHMGDIKVISEEGKGTTFNVYLPLMKTSNKIVDSEQVSLLQTGTERLLLVDDEESVMRLEKQMLQRLGYQVDAYSSSIEALEAFKAHPDDYDLVVSDMAMPKMTGDKLAGEILSIRSNIPIIICTGFSERINREQAEAIGVNGFLMKPIVKSEMAHMVRKILDESSSREKI